MTLSFTFATGTTYQGVAGWQAGNFFGSAATSNGMATAGNVFEIFDVGLYLDKLNTSLPPPWQMPDEAAELLACQRYWEQAVSGIYGYQSASSTAMAPVAFKATKRITNSAAAIVSNGSTLNAAGWATYGMSAQGCLYGANAVALGAVASWPSVININARM